MPYFLSRYDADALRFHLTAVAPETRDTEFSWEDFVERNKIRAGCDLGQPSYASPQGGGQRPRVLGFMLSFAYKRFDGKVPEPGELDEDRALLVSVEGGFRTVGDLYNACMFRSALGEALALAREANGYTCATLPSAPLGTGSAGLDRKAPWFQIKEDRVAPATTVYVILRAVDNLKTILAPILPHTAQKLHEYLGYDGQLFGTQHWAFALNPKYRYNV